MPIPDSLALALADFKSRLWVRFGERLRDVRLFGSHARGEAHEDSDVDVLVVVDGLTWDEFRQVSADATPVILDTGWPIVHMSLSSERLAQIHASERLLGRVLDEEGISL